MQNRGQIGGITQTLAGTDNECPRATFPPEITQVLLQLLHETLDLNKLPMLQDLTIQELTKLTINGQF